jgi:two-component system, OmpR family, copper resistance phosphate regulon response regulator CusR
MKTEGAENVKILVVEDEKKVASFIKRGLEAEKYTVAVAHDGAEGLKQALTGEYNLVVTDLLMPKKDGLTLIAELREAGSRVPVLILSARGTSDDIVSGLDAGADDYLSKPFAVAELSARVKALLRRCGQERGAELHYADLRLDPVAHKVWRGGTEIVVTGKEYGMIEYMMRNPETVLTRKILAENVWDYEFSAFTNIVDVYINYVRKIIDQDYPTKLIHTVRGQGYILKDVGR